MKKIKIMLAAAVICICFTGITSSAGVMAQQPDVNRPYLLNENQPNPFKETTHINFYLAQDCYVKLYTIDEHNGETHMLVDGEMTAGEHGIVFKALAVNTTKNYKCYMEIFLADGKVLTERLSIDMKQVDGTENNAARK